MRLSNMGWSIMSVAIIELTLVLLGGTSGNESFLFDFMRNPSTASGFYILVTALLGAFAIAVFVSSFIQLNTPAVYAIFSLGVLGFSGVLIQLMSFVSGQVSGLSAPIAWIINILIVGPMLIIYLFTLMEWVREK